MGCTLVISLFKDTSRNMLLIELTEFCVLLLELDERELLIDDMAVDELEDEIIKLELLERLLELDFDDSCASAELLTDWLVVVELNATALPEDV
jgi:hypothetical protein